jgi:anti-sigma factor RsiW
MAISEGPLSADLSRYLEGQTYPARKDEVVRTLRRHHAPYEVVAHVEAISEPDGTFKSYEHLRSAYDNVRMNDPSPKEGVQKKH